MTDLIAQHVECTNASHDALKANESAFRAACEYRYEQHIGPRVFHMWRCRSCMSDLAGPVS